MVSFTFIEGASSKSFESFIDNESAKPLNHLKKELDKIRTGRAHTSFIEDVKVPYNNSIRKLKELASLSAPDPYLLTVQPWDPSISDDIEKALTTADLGVTPVREGHIIKLPLPRMSSARRIELSKMVTQRLEEYKVGMRAIRKEVHTLIRDAEKTKKISEDYSKRLVDVLQKMIDKYSEIGDKLAQKKNEELTAM